MDRGLSVPERTRQPVQDLDPVVLPRDQVGEVISSPLPPAQQVSGLWPAQCSAHRRSTPRTSLTSVTPIAVRNITKRSIRCAYSGSHM